MELSKGMNKHFLSNRRVISRQDATFVLQRCSKSRRLTGRDETPVSRYVLERPLDTNDPDVWSGDVELGWPWA